MKKQLQQTISHFTIALMLFIVPLNVIIANNKPEEIDGPLNDFFAPKGAEFESFEMEIYSRWGERIYHTTDIDKPWDGKLQSKNQIVQEGVYVYKIWVKDFKVETHNYVGNVSLISLI